MKYIFLSILIFTIGLNLYSQNLRNPVDNSGNGLSNINSDWGPRNFTDGSRFHAGLDYSPLPNGVAYALEGGTPLLFSSQGFNSYIRVGRWTYMHVLIDSTGNNNWTLKDPVCSKHILLETIGANGQTKIFVDSDDNRYLGVTRWTKWGTPATTTRTAAANDIVFRPNSGNHLHLQTTEMDNWVNPLTYIAYNGSNTNNMNLDLRMKYNNGVTATEFPSYNQMFNVVYGDEVIVESDVNYVGEYDLNVTKVEAKKIGGNYETIAEWKYSGSNHLTFSSRYNGIGTSTYYNSYPQGSDSQTRSLNTILSDPREGMHPVLTGGNNLGREIFKRHWNTQQGWNTNAPAYPDGEYVLRLTTEDVRGNGSDDIVEIKMIDNLKPYIKKVEVSPESNPYSIVYEAEWSFDAGGDFILSSPQGSGLTTYEDVKVDIYTSEPMSNLDVEINNNYSQVYSVSDDHWYCWVSANELMESNQITILNSSKDLAGNELYGFSEQERTSRSYQSSNFPRRTSTGEWSNSYSFDDVVHVFGAESGSSMECVAPPESLIISEDEFGGVKIEWFGQDPDFKFKVYRSSDNNFDHAKLNPLTPNWIEEWYYYDDDPMKGETNYYFVVSSKESIFKSASDDCSQYTMDALFVPQDDENFIDVVPFWDPMFGNEYVFYIDFYSNNSSLSFDVRMNFDDGTIQEISNYYGGDPIFYTYDDNNGFEDIPRYPKATITVIDGSIDIDEFEVPFEEIIIPHIEHELEVSIDNDFAVVAQSATFNAVCNYARPDVSGVHWEWCISQTAGNTDPCELNSSIHVSQDTESNETQVTATFPSEGNYCIKLKVSDFYQEKEFTHNVFVSENCLSISRKPDPALVDGLEIPDDCPDGTGFTLDIPSDFKIGNCDGYDCYIKKIYLPERQNTYKVYYNVGGLNPEPTYPSKYYLESDIEGWMPLDYIVYAQRYSKTNRAFVGDYIEYEMPAPPSAYANCGKTDYCNTSIILDRIINFTQNQDLRFHYGHYIFEGEGGKIANRDLDLVARKSIKLRSGTQIKNSNFRISTIPCDYSVCNLFKSLFVEGTDNMDGEGVLVENGLILYPNPACE
jgi:hypothetical protein